MFRKILEDEFLDEFLQLYNGFDKSKPDSKPILKVKQSKSNKSQC